MIAKKKRIVFLCILAAALIFLTLYFVDVHTKLHQGTSIFRTKQYVYDRAHLIAEPFNVYRNLKDFHQEHNIQFVVYTVEDIPGDDPVHYAVDLLEELRVGGEADGNGILLLISQQEQYAQLAVSMNIEHVFTDLLTGNVQEKQFIPYFEFGDVTMAVQDVIQMLSNWAFDHAYEILDVSGGGDESQYLTLGAGAKVAHIILGKGTRAKHHLPARKKVQFTARPTPEETFELYIQTLQQNISDPSLDIYTEGTRLMLGYWPWAEYQNNEYLQIIEQGRPFRAEIQGDFAVIRMAAGAKRQMPYFLYKGADGWQVDLVSYFRDMRYTAQGNWFLSNRYSPYNFAFEKTRNHERVIRKREDVQEKIAAFQQKIANHPTRCENYALLADVYWFDCWMTFKALEYYEKACALCPDNPEINRKVAEAYYRILYPRRGLKYYRQLAGLQPGEKSIWEILDYLYEYAENPLMSYYCRFRSSLL